MRKETAIELIEDKSLSPDEIKKTIAKVSDMSVGEVLQAAFASGILSDAEIHELAESYSAKERYIWGYAVNSFRQYDQEKWFLLLLKLGMDYDKEHESFRMALNHRFRFAGLPTAEALQKGFALAALANSDGYVYQKMLTHTGYSQEQLILIGEIADKPDVWKAIFKRLDLKKFTKNELKALKVKAPCMLPEILKIGKFSSQETLKSLKEGISSSYRYCFSTDDVAEILIKVCKLKPKQLLRLARKWKNDIMLWAIVPKNYRRLKLSQADLVAIFKYGDCGDRIKAIKKLDAKTMEKFAQELLEAKSSVSLSWLGELLASGKISKDIACELAKQADYDTCWIGLIDSGHFSDAEIVAMAGEISAASYRSSYWARACEVLDLSIYSYDELTHFGEWANSNEAWSKIRKILKARKLIKA